jgi:hypothetical protein
MVPNAMPVPKWIGSRFASDLGEFTQNLDTLVEFFGRLEPGSEFDPTI